MRKVGGSLSETNNAGLIADSSLVCGALGNGKKVGAIFTTLKGRHLDTFDSDLLILLATQYQCPSRVSQATRVEVDALNQSGES